ncbi:damage-inducible protein DinB [Paraflavitalea soli]|uniref:Damage-inducible protein DinB n=1 Tax=Paraflavitalea soli TaxID=2315862 RepID=A0A3B7MUN3_9BACT|nr:DinB family protein [Paraflavitalea soli]AXY76716.1 damage-inducible protein DinB [Paraflavitalea soli]
MLYTSFHRSSLLTQLQDLATYNCWAITRLTDWLKSKPAVLLEASAASSFPGIKATLLHIWEVEREWMGHLQQRPNGLQQGIDDDLTTVLNRLVEQAADFSKYVQSLTEEEVQEDCYCQLWFSETICRPRFEIIQHCLNHSTYHRGQVVTIGHQVGLKDAPMTDYMFYVLKVKEQASGSSKTETPANRKNTDSYGRNSFLAVNFFSKQ